MSLEGYKKHLRKTVLDQSSPLNTDVHKIIQGEIGAAKEYFKEHIEWEYITFMFEENPEIGVIYLINDKYTEKEIEKTITALKKNFPQNSIWKISEFEELFSKTEDMDEFRKINDLKKRFNGNIKEGDK